MADSNALNIGPEELRCLLTLQRHRVEFMIVGGYAVRYHGHMRAAKDIDVLVGNDQMNAERLCLALTDILRVALPNVTPEQFLGRKRQVNLEQWNLRFEILTGADGVCFSEAYARSVPVTMGAAAVAVIAKGDLIAMKKAAGRATDLSDVAALQSIQ
jgi:hypothetical protein